MKVDLGAVETGEHFAGLHAAFPLSSANGTVATAIVYMEVDPGGELPSAPGQRRGSARPRG